jgi:signal peptide peptidase SppA
MAERSAVSSLAEFLRRLVPPPFRAKRPVVPVVRLTGVIGGAIPFRRGLSLNGCAPALDRAFGIADIKAVAISVNSPGGSAVQSHLIFRRIRDLAEEKKVPVFVFVEDVAASGGYMIACAGDEIFADPSSLVGSIGVVYAGFGLDRLIERLGVERRIHTMGERKAMLDPFRPEDDADVARLAAIQGRVHEMFAGLVRSRRGGRLKAEPDDLFTGAVWSGAEGADLGLVDGLGDLRAVLRQRFGDKVRLRPISSPPASLLARWFSRRQPSVGPSVDAGEMIAALEERLAWWRWGL